MQVHGDEDKLVPYEGGKPPRHPSLAELPSALKGVSDWLSADGCTKGEVKSELDLDEKLPGGETVKSSWKDCKRPVELWTIRGGSHFTPVGAGVQAAALQFALGQ